MPEANARLRQPVVVVLGHVDSGKTSLLDALRGTAVQAREVGGITQEIGASFFPLKTLEQICGPLLERAGGELQIPGLLMIDTPGHAVFSNLRLRGGSAADIAIVVVDVLKGLENQTLESIDILKQRKVPFLVALNKVDMIKGWRKGSKGPLQSVLGDQPPEWNDELEERLYNVVGGLSRLGFQADAYYRVKEFRQQVTIVPVSARAKIGIPELLAVLIGLSQHFLKGRLRVTEEGRGGKGIILEMQEETGIGETANVILTEGMLRVGDSIGLVRREGAFKSKVKALFMPKPLDEIRDPRDKFTPVDSVYAAAGVKLVSADLAGVVAGTSVASFETDAQFVTLKAEMEKELTNILVKTENMGVIVRAASVGGLEAVLRMLEEREIPVRRADIGDITKNDIVEAEVVGEHDPYLAAILGFDSKVLSEAKEFVGSTPIFVSGVIYEVIDNYANWAAAKRESDQKGALSSMTRPCKLRVLPGAFFRRNDPAVFGVEVLAGMLKPKVRLMSSDGRELGTVEQIQENGKAVAEVKQGDKVAISVDGPTLGRQVKEEDTIYTLPRSHEARMLRTKYLGSLTEDELKALEDIIKIKGLSDVMYGF
jgi:translation initiation factor 5B